MTSIEKLIRKYERIVRISQREEDADLLRSTFTGPTMQSGARGATISWCTQFANDLRSLQPASTRKKANKTAKAK